MKRLISILLACAFSLPASAAVQAWLDHNQVDVGDSVQLTLQRDGRGGQPDLAPLQKDFDVLGTSSGSSIQIVNGQMSSQVQVVVTLSPKHAGRLQIPPLDWSGEQSPSLTLVVGGSASGSSGGQAGGQASGSASGTSGIHNSHVFLDDTLDQHQPYVQGAAVLTVKLFADQPLYQASLDLEASADVLVQQIGKDQQTTETRNGRNYQVIARSYLLFPQRSGALSLPGPVMDAQIAAQNGNPFGGMPSIGSFFGNGALSGMFNSTKPIRIHGDTIQLDVRPRPASWTAKNWLPAQQLSLDETWQPEPSSIHTGEPLTRHLRLNVAGLAGTQLPDLSTLMSLPDGLKAYPDQPKLNTALNDGKLVGSREQDIALIASRPGHYQLPALKLAWWDTQSDSERVAILPARTLDVLPAAGSAAQPQTPGAAVPAPANPGSVPPPASPKESSAPSAAAAAYPWPWISLALLLAWLGTLGGWWFERRRRRPAAKSEPESAALAAGQKSPPPAARHRGNAEQAFRQACRDRDPKAARRELLNWARAHWPEAPPNGLDAVAARLGDAQLQTLLQQLDRACYGGGDWNGTALSQALKALPQSQARPKQAAGLATLYP